jgi:hypothetical protein
VYKKLKASEIVVNGFTHILSSNQAEINNPIIYSFLKSDTEISNLNTVAPGVRKALVHDDYMFKVNVMSYKINKTVSIPSYDQ